MDHAARRVVTVRGDKADPLSQGYICPKAYAIKEMQEDRDILDQPMIKRNGRFEPASWDEALDFAAAGIRQVQEKHGRSAVAFYFGTGAGAYSGVDAVYAEPADGAWNRRRFIRVPALTAIRIF